MIVNSCINCKYMKLDEILGNPTCKLKSHLCTYRGVGRYKGKQILDSRVIDCQDGIRNEDD